MYRVEVYGNDIYIGKIFCYPDDTEFFPVSSESVGVGKPVFISEAHDNYWDAYDESDAWVQARRRQ